MGNRKTATVNTAQTSYTPNTLNQYTTITPSGAPTISLSYDNDGNLINDVTWVYTWNGENRLMAMEKADQKITFMYDYQGRRVRKQVYSGSAGAWNLDTETHFFYDGWNLIQERVHTATQKTENAYLWGIDLSGSLQGAGGVGGLLAMTQNANSSPQTAFPSYDGNGNVTKLIAASDGSIQNSYTYDPFGNIIDSQSTEKMPNPFTFSTKYHDPETGFHYYGYRYYNPQTGRWLNRDPIRENGGINLYGFVYNDPVNTYDINGQIAPALVAVLAASIWVKGCQYFSVKKAREVFPGSDKRQHCYGSCFFTRCTLSPQLSFLGGLIHELVNNNYGLSDALRDIRANIHGIIGAYSFNSCEEECEDCPDEDD